jgi:hypothetical protein
MAEVDDCEIDAEHVLDGDLFGVWYITDNGETTRTSIRSSSPLRNANSVCCRRTQSSIRPTARDAHHVLGDEPEYAIAGLWRHACGSPLAFCVVWAPGYLGDAAYGGLGFN